MNVRFLLCEKARRVGGVEAGVEGFHEISVRALSKTFHMLRDWWEGHDAKEKTKG